MASGRWKLYNTAKEKIGQAIIDLDGHAFKLALYTSSSNCNTLTFDELADLTNQVPNGNGYTTGGFSLTGVTWVNSSGTIKFTSAGISFAVTGSGISSLKYAVIYDDTVAGDPLLAVCDLAIGSSGLNAVSGDFVTISMNASGIFTLSGGNID